MFTGAASGRLIPQAGRVSVMDDKTHPLLERLTILSIGLGAGVAIWRARWLGRRGLRLIGLWSYLAAVNGGAPEMTLVLAAERASAGDELVRPYWGSEEPWVAAQRLQEATTELPSGPAGIAGRSTGRTA